MKNQEKGLKLKEDNIINNKQTVAVAHEEDLEKLKEDILKKEKEYSNSLDENLNGNETILQELIALKKKRSKLIGTNKAIVMNSYVPVDKTKTVAVAHEEKSNKAVDIAHEEKNIKLELEQLKEDILEKEKAYSNSLDENLNGDEIILQELIALKKKRSKLIETNKAIVINSYVSDTKDKKDTISNKETVQTPKANKTIKENEVRLLSRKDIKVEDTNNIVMKHAVFDITKGVWCFEFCENGLQKQSEYRYKKEEIKKLDRYVKEKRKKYGNKKLKKIDIGLYSALCGFDIEHKANYSQKYLHDEIPYSVTYNLTKLFKVKFYSFKDKVNLLYKAKSQNKYKNAIVYNPRFTVLKPAVFGITLLLGFFGVSAKKDEPSYNKSIQCLQEKIIDENSIGHKISDDTASIDEKTKSSYYQDNQQQLDNGSKIEQLYKLRNELTSNVNPNLESNKVYTKVM